MRDSTLPGKDRAASRAVLGWRPLHVDSSRLNQRRRSEHPLLSNGHTEAASAYRVSTRCGQGACGFRHCRTCRHDVINDDDRPSVHSGSPPAANPQRVVQVEPAGLGAELRLVTDAPHVTERGCDLRWCSRPAAAASAAGRRHRQVADEVRATPPPIPARGGNRNQDQPGRTGADGESAGRQRAGERRSERLGQVVPAAVLPRHDEPGRDATVGGGRPDARAVRPCRDGGVARPRRHQAEAGRTQDDVGRAATRTCHRPGERRELSATGGERARPGRGELGRTAPGERSGVRRCHASTLGAAVRPGGCAGRNCGQLAKVIGCGSGLVGYRPSRTGTAGGGWAETAVGDWAETADRGWRRRLTGAGRRPLAGLGGDADGGWTETADGGWTETADGGWTETVGPGG